MRLNKAYRAGAAAGTGRTSSSASTAPPARPRAWREAAGARGVTRSCSSGSVAPSPLLMELLPFRETKALKRRCATKRCAIDSARRRAQSPVRRNPNRPQTSSSQQDNPVRHAVYFDAAPWQMQCERVTGVLAPAGDYPKWGYLHTRKKTCTPWR
jgi:hypothetical protein